MLVRFDPWREFDRLTGGLLGDVRSSMPMDVFRKGDEYVLNIDLPGVDPDSIDLTVNGKVLTVKAERHPVAGDGAEVLISERPTGSYIRRISLGEEIDVDNLKANYEHGVLTVVLPIAESAKPKKVEITAGETPKALESETQAA